MMVMFNLLRYKGVPLMENKRPEEMERITTRALADAFIEEQIAAVKAQF